VDIATYAFMSNGPQRHVEDRSRCPMTSAVYVSLITRASYDQCSGKHVWVETFDNCMQQVCTREKGLANSTVALVRAGADNDKQSQEIRAKRAVSISHNVQPSIASQCATAK
jgi:hypothetical protein